MPLSLIVHLPPKARAVAAGSPTRTITFDSPRIVIGRGEGCEVLLPEESVQERHASLRQRGGSYLLVDEGSENGTFVGGARLAPQAPRLVKHGDRIRVGRVWLEIYFDASELPSPAPKRKHLALWMVQEILRAEGEACDPWLECIDGPDAGSKRTLNEEDEPIALGRGQACEWVLEEGDASRKHAEVLLQGSDLLVRDLNSKNGTFLGEHPLPPGRDIALRPGETFAIGADLFAFQLPAADALPEFQAGRVDAIAPDERFPTPGNTPRPALLAPSTPPPGAAEADSAGEEPSEPPPDVSEQDERLAPSESKGGGWGLSDGIVLLFALAVLGLSIAGLKMVFGGQH